MTEQSGIRPSSGMKATVYMADEYDVDELNENLETVHIVKKKTEYNLRKHYIFNLKQKKKNGNQ